MRRKKLIVREWWSVGMFQQAPPDLNILQWGALQEFRIYQLD